MSTPPSSSPSLSLSVDNVQRRLCDELLSISSNASCDMEWRWSGYRSDGQSEQIGCGMCCLSLSNSLQGIFCPPLPGQVPVEPALTSNGLTPYGALEASSVINSSTEKPTQHRMKKGFCSLVKRMWKFIKRPFRSCFCSRAVNVVEPFVPPPDLDGEPNPVPDHVGVKPNKESFDSHYDVVKLIGSGGFGMVYEGKRKFDGKKVAIKRMRKIDNDRYLVIPGHPKPLVTEVALLLMMRKGPKSPYVIELYAWFEHPRKFTLIMEYPEPCESLLDFLIRNPIPDEKTARSIMRQAALAVQHCIEHGVFHNDVHPQNLLLKTDTLELKLIDFGSGQLLESDGYESDTYIGLLDYCPPEIFTQPRFHAVPTNVWALGVLLYEMMNACAPFRNSREITQAKVRFQNSNLSKGNNILGLLSLAEGLNSRLDLKSNPSLTGSSSCHTRAQSLSTSLLEHDRLQD